MCGKFDEICNLWMKNRSAQKDADPEMTAKYQISHASNEFKGTYVHPHLMMMKNIFLILNGIRVNV